MFKKAHHMFKKEIRLSLELIVMRTEKVNY